MKRRVTWSPRPCRTAGPSQGLLLLSLATLLLLVLCLLILLRS